MPFTYNQVVVVRTNRAHPVGRIHLPKGFLLIATIYDVRFTKEHNGAGAAYADTSAQETHLLMTFTTQGRHVR
jgi:hypothetical protein